MGCSHSCVLIYVLFCFCFVLLFVIFVVVLLFHVLERSYTYPICTKKKKNKQVPFQQKLVSNLHLLLPPPYKTTHNNNQHPLLQQNKLVPCNVLSLYPHNLIVLMKVIVKVMQVTSLHAGTCVTMKCTYFCCFVETFGSLCWTNYPLVGTLLADICLFLPSSSLTSSSDLFPSFFPSFLLSFSFPFSVEELFLSMLLLILM